MHVMMTFKFVVEDKCVSQPDLGNNLTSVSLIECATLCLLRQGCLMWNLWPQDNTNICQLSKKKGTCMEQEEVFSEEGCHMFEKKVGNEHEKNHIQKYQTFNIFFTYMYISLSLKKKR